MCFYTDHVCAGDPDAYRPLWLIMQREVIFITYSSFEYIWLRASRTGGSSGLMPMGKASSYDAVPPIFTTSYSKFKQTDWFVQACRFTSSVMTWISTTLINHFGTLLLYAWPDGLSLILKLSTSTNVFRGGWVGGGVIVCLFCAGWGVGGGQNKF